MLQNIQLKTYELNNRVNWAELKPDGKNPYEGEIAPLEEFINKVFSNDEKIGVLNPKFWASLTTKQQERIFADYNEAWDKVQEIRRSIQEAYNQFHHGAPREVNMDLKHNESDDEAEGDIHGMGLHGRGAKISLAIDPVRVIDDKHAIAQYVKDHESEMKAHCLKYSYIIDRFADEDHILIVYEELGKNEGFAFTYIDGNYPNDLYLALLCANKGRGIGTILLSRVEDLAQQLNVDYVVLEPADAYATQFYQHNGYAARDDSHLMYKEVKPMEARSAVAPPPVLEPEEDEADMGSGLPDRGSMFHAGLNRLYGCGNTSGRPVVEEDSDLPGRIERRELKERVHRSYSRFIHYLDIQRRDYPEYADQFDLYEAQISEAYNDYMEAIPFVPLGPSLNKLQRKTLEKIESTVRTVIFFRVLVAEPDKRARRAEREQRAAPDYVPEDASNQISGAGYNGRL